MPADIIQADYEQLETIAARFGQQAESSATLLNRLTQNVEQLRGAGWEGEAAQAFFNEMDGAIFPAMQRLTGAMEQAQSTTLQAKSIMRQAEEEAAALFGDDTGEAIEGGAGDGGSPGTPGPGSVDPSNPAIVRDVKSLFSNQYMDSFVGIKIRGEDSQRLNDAMEALYKNPTGDKLERILTEIADIRGVPVEDLKAQYQKYLTLRQEAATIAAQKGKDPPVGVNEFFHGDFMGSTAQLRYGKVVGDAFGIDPVFGALLNPTGGMVGPGNWAVNPGDNDALGYHGIFHDAAGYLYNHHNVGPGYDYLGQEGHRDPGNPLVGQQSGVRYWYEKLNPGLTTDIALDVGDAVINTTETVIDTVDTGIEAVKDFGDRVDDFIKDTSGAIAGGVDDALDLIF